MSGEAGAVALQSSFSPLPEDGFIAVIENLSSGAIMTEEQLEGFVGRFKSMVA